MEYISGNKFREILKLNKGTIFCPYMYVNIDDIEVYDTDCIGFDSSKIYYKKEIICCWNLGKCLCNIISFEDNLITFKCPFRNLGFDYHLNISG